MELETVRSIEQLDIKDKTMIFVMEESNWASSMPSVTLAYFPIE